MRGPFPLSPLQVNCRIPTKVRGVYCLSKTPKRIDAICCSDSDLKDDIQSHGSGYLFFWYETTLSKRESFLLQCRYYHNNLELGLEDKAHPVPPAGLDAPCPVCGSK